MLSAVAARGRLLFILSAVMAFAAQQSPNLTELRQRMEDDVREQRQPVDDSLVSQPPSTLLTGMQRSTCPPRFCRSCRKTEFTRDLYFGMNLATPGRPLETGLVVSNHIHRAARPRSLLSHL